MWTGTASTTWLIGSDLLYGGDFLGTVTAHASDVAGETLTGTLEAEQLIGNCGG